MQGPSRQTEAAIDTLHDLAAACGLARHWRDLDGHEQVVPDETLAAILEGLGYAVGTDPAAITDQRGRLPRMLVVDAGERVALPFAHGDVEATGEDGHTVRLAVEGRAIFAPTAPGYYDLDLGGDAIRLAVAPARAPGMPADGKFWGSAVQIPALRGRKPSPFGTFGELAVAAKELAARGAAAIAINPVHALFPGEGRDFSPYSPSSRLFLNGAMGDPSLVGLAPLPPSAGPGLIDWEQALPARLVQLRAVFATLDAEFRSRIASDPAMTEPNLRRHALFDALYCYFSAGGARGWRDWPSGYHDPDGPLVAQFAREHREEVEFHVFVQWLAFAGLSASQRAARAGGMDVGLIGDLAVGVSTYGSDSWSLRDGMLTGLTVGAPPDPLGPLGQNWHISTFSPDGLRRTGYAPFIAMLRAGFAAGGGLRVDHAFGLERLWVIPDGGGATEGSYLSYPFHDLLRLVILEAHRAGAIVIAENLGTSPFGFAETIIERGTFGMEVLWFERAPDHGFYGADSYLPTNVAMTGTHDTPTVAGWWSGRDLDWAETCGRLPSGTDRAEVEGIREWDRGMLWSTIGDDAPRPVPDDPAPVVDAAIAHIAATPAPLVILPLEDLLAEREQPNLPGTIAGHPNWRRRIENPIDEMLDTPEVTARMAALSRRGD